MEEDREENKQMNIKVTDEMLKGVYANKLQVAHTTEEFVLDFMFAYPPSGTLASRVIVSPSHMKRIAKALQDNIEKYESQYGEIDPKDNVTNNFAFKSND